MAGSNEGIKSIESNFVDPKAVKVVEDKFRGIGVIVNGETYHGIRISRAFPFTNPSYFIGFYDGEGKELGIVENMDKLDKNSRKILERYFEKAYFVPIIKKVTYIDDRHGVSTWYVETDKGKRDFDVRGKRESVRTISRMRIIVEDIDGNKYDIPDYSKLDEGSFNFIEEYI